jgi:hypothetical protein
MGEVVVKIPWITQKKNWNKEDYYNFEDLNRVEKNTQYVKEQCENILNYQFSVFNFVKNRDNTRFEFAEDLNRIEGNILALKNASYEPLVWVNPKTNWQDLDSFDKDDANRLENNIDNLKEMIEDIERNLPRCGALVCGSGHGLGYGLTSNIDYQLEWLLNDDIEPQQGNIKYIWIDGELWVDENKWKD